MIIKCNECGQKNRVAANRLDDGATCGACKSTLPGTGRVHKVKPEVLDNLIANSPMPVLVDYWSPTCGPCLMVAPELEALAASKDDVVVVKLNTQNYPHVAMREGIRGIPMFIVYKDGERLAEPGLADLERRHQALRVDGAVGLALLLAVAQVHRHLLVVEAFQGERDAHAVGGRGAVVAIQSHRVSRTVGLRGRGAGTSSRKLRALASIMIPTPAAIGRALPS